MRPEQLSILKILWRSGTQQADRIDPALDPDFFRLMDLDPQDWMLFAQNFGRLIPFFSEQFPMKVIGYWSKFFEQILNEEPIPQRGTSAYQNLKDRLRIRLEVLEEQSSMIPHLGLMYSFFKLMDYSKSRINQLSNRHLDFYYKDILQLNKKSAKPDQVYLVLELAKIPQVRIPKGTQFEAGKDSLGKKLLYQSTGEFYPNLAKLFAQKNRYTGEIQINTIETNKIAVSQIANSFDGNGADFPQGLPSWWPFGHLLDNPSLQGASFGFTLAVAALKSPEGSRRYFSFIFNFEHDLKIEISPAKLIELFNCEVSGEKGWIPLIPSKDVNLEGFTNLLDSKSKKLQLTFFIEENLPSLVDASSNVHGDLETSGIPLIRFGVKSNTDKGFDLLRSLSTNFLTSVEIKSSIQGIQTPVLESDLGVLQAGKPFMPFTSIPKKGSSLYLYEPSWKNKKLKEISLRLNWANTPECAENSKGNQSDFSCLYAHYKDSGGKNAIVKNDSYFKFNISVRDSVNWNGKETSQTLFSKEEGQFITDLVLVDEKSKTLSANNGIKLTLNQSFLHEMYPKLYALAMASEQPETLIPNEPYTPLVEQLTLGYTTSEIFLMDQDTDLKLFLWDDFGYFEEKRSKKEKLAHVISKRTQLTSFPVANGGELFLNIADLQPNQQLSILFQVLEGSENPAHSTFASKDKIQWSVLVSDYWFTLENKHILSDETDNFLRSGIITFQLPLGAFERQTRMTLSGVWIRAYSPKPFDSTAKIVAILPQAIKATFVDRQNDLSHLTKGLPPKTITKMTERISGVKSVNQPFNSFGGRPQESDIGFYTHVSERLRHKNRAVSLWDYEHLILDHFPEVHKVKCLNHTNRNSFTAPGSVLVLVIPDTVDKNVFDNFKPLFSTARLNEIREFLLERVSPAIEISVDNPSFEEVHIELKVKFRSGLDPAFYRNQLEQDIINYLSPWALQPENTIAFGINLQESLLIHQLEKLSYLEYLQDLVMKKNNQSYYKKISPSSPKHILVSSKNHTIVPL